MNIFSSRHHAILSHLPFSENNQFLSVPAMWTIVFSDLWDMQIVSDHHSLSRCFSFMQNVYLYSWACKWCWWNLLKPQWELKGLHRWACLLESAFPVFWWPCWQGTSACELWIVLICEAAAFIFELRFSSAVINVGFSMVTCGVSLRRIQRDISPRICSACVSLPKDPHNVQTVDPCSAGKKYAFNPLCIY